MTLEERIRQGDKNAIKALYLDNQKLFLGFAKRYPIDIMDIEDTYQDAIVVLIENIRKGKILDLKSKVSTYLFAIGKLMIFQRLKKGKKLDYRSDFDNLGLVWEEFDETNFKEKETLLSASFEKLGEQCKRLLALFYYENKKLDNIMEIMNYESKDVVKSQKSRCLKQLKEIIKRSNT